MDQAEMTSKVRKIIEELRPYLQMHGGDMDFVELTDDKVVRVKLQGACAGCPGAILTLKMGVEHKLKQAVPEISAVEAVPM